MVKIVVASLLLALVSSNQAIAADCHYVNGDVNLYFLSPAAIAVDPQHGLMPYACQTSSAGTGVMGRMASCTDGFYGPLVYNDDETVTFRSAVWEPACEEGDLSVLDLMGN